MTKFSTPANKTQQEQEQEQEKIVSVMPPVIPFNPNGIPQELKNSPNWVLWANVTTTKNPKPTKRPVGITKSRHTLHLARWASRQNHHTFNDALNLLALKPDELGGLGFVLTPASNIVLIDYDKVLDQNQQLYPDDPRNQHLQSLSTKTFVELSQSGKGAHVFCMGNLTDRFNASVQHGVELYPGQKSSFVAMTGQPYNNAPLQLVNCQADIDAHLRQFCGIDTASSHDSKPAYTPPESLSEGERNSGMAQYVGHLLAQNLSKEQVVREAFLFNLTRVHPPLDNHELISIIESIASRHKDKFAHIAQDVVFIKTGNQWFDFSCRTVMCKEAVNTSYYNQGFHGKKEGMPTVSQWLKQHPDFRQVDNLSWLPCRYGDDSRIFDADGKTFANSWAGYQTSPVPAQSPCDIQPWLTHLAHVIPEQQYRDALIYWLAYTLQHPDVKIAWCPIILGISGAGKDALFRPVAQILGQSYKIVGNREIKGDYDDGLWQTKLLQISEARLRGGAIEFFKRITAPESTGMMLLNIKGQPKREQLNLCNVVVITNNFDALKLDATDRRAFVLYAPEVMTPEQTMTYFAWVKANGAAHLFRYLLDYDLNASPYSPTELPYRTSHFLSMVDLTQSDEENSLDAFFGIDNVFPFDAITPKQAIELCALKKFGYYSESQAAKWLLTNGWTRWDGNNPNLQIQANINGTVNKKTRKYYVKKSSPTKSMNATAMWHYCNEVEAWLTLQSQYKFG